MLYRVVIRDTKVLLLCLREDDRESLLQREESTDIPQLNLQLWKRPTEEKPSTDASCAAFLESVAVASQLKLWEDEVAGLSEATPLMGGRRTEIVRGEEEEKH